MDRAISAGIEGEDVVVTLRLGGMLPETRPEFDRRAERDGAAAAVEWLTEQALGHAEDLIQQQLIAMKETVAQIDARIAALEAAKTGRVRLDVPETTTEPSGR